MELELKHLAPYLPYGLNLQYIVRDVLERCGTMVSITHDKGSTHPTKIALDYYDSEHIWMFKPLLRPMSDLEGEKECEALVKFIKYPNYKNLPVWLFEDLISQHFDVFGLIPAGLAIDINQTNLSPSH